MSPRAIARRAREAGLDAIAVCDHNSARNAPALQAACVEVGVACLCGLEIATAEELHALALFDSVQAALTMTDTIYAGLPSRVNVPDVFGDQPVVDVDEQVLELEWRMLSASTRLTVGEVAAVVHALGGLFVAAHVDRPSFSVSSQLGMLSGDEGFDAMELTRHAKPAYWRNRFPGLPVLCASDAHELDEIGAVWNEAELATFSVHTFRAALVAGGVRAGRMKNDSVPK